MEQKFHSNSSDQGWLLMNMSFLLCVAFISASLILRYFLYIFCTKFNSRAHIGRNCEKFAIITQQLADDLRLLFCEGARDCRKNGQKSKVGCHHQPTQSSAESKSIILYLRQIDGNVDYWLTEKWQQFSELGWLLLHLARFPFHDKKRRKLFAVRSSHSTVSCHSREKNSRQLQYIW